MLNVCLNFSIVTLLVSFSACEGVVAAVWLGAAFCDCKSTAGSQSSGKILSRRVVARALWNILCAGQVAATKTITKTISSTIVATWMEAALWRARPQVLLADGVHHRCFQDAGAGFRPCQPQGGRWGAMDRPTRCCEDGRRLDVSQV